MLKTAYGVHDDQIAGGPNWLDSRGIGDIVFDVETDRTDYVQAGLRALGHCLGTVGRRL